MFKKIHISLILLLAILFQGCLKNNLFDFIDNFYSQISSNSDCPALFIYDAKKNPHDSSRGFQGCPTIGYDGKYLYAAWICGIRDEELGNYLSVSISKDSGRTWVANKLLIVPKHDSGRCIEPSLWRDKFGKLHLFFTTINNGGMWDGGASGVWDIGIEYVNDKILITNPKRLGSGILITKPCPSIIDSNSVFFPIYNWNCTFSGIYNGKYFAVTPSNINGTIVYKSSYNLAGNLILPLSKISPKVPISVPRNFDEPNLVDLGEKKLLLMRRTTSDGINQCISNDNGITWGKDTVFTALGPTTSSRFFLGKLKSGNILFVLNNNVNRKTLTAYLSKNGGISWPYRLVLEPNQCSYPDVIQDNSGNVFVVWDKSRATQGFIYISKFTENDILNGDSSKVKSYLVSKVK